jgi:DNA polymerase III subunit epsilon
MLKHFSRLWNEVPTVWIDTETTGVRPGVDKAVQVGIARFEGGVCVDSNVCEINPGRPIPAEASAIHGITDDRVKDAPTIEEFFADSRTQRLLDGAQPAAYNAAFDRHFVPPFGEDWTWPWLDSLSLVRVVDRFARGKGRHRLEAACQRWDVELQKAHDAGSDALAAGQLFYKLVPQLPDCPHVLLSAAPTLGMLLCWQRQQEANEWFRFNEWLSRQPPRETAHG